MSTTTKNKKTKIYLGSAVPASATLAAAVTAADVGMGCMITTLAGIGLSRGTTEDDAVLCEEGSFKVKDTDEMEISNFTASGYVYDSAEYLAVAALADAMIKADTRGTFLLVEPNGTDKLWMEMKILKWEIERGGAEDKKKFSIELLPMTIPADA